jgi:long-chain acyl-CoA synthetase
VENERAGADTFPKLLIHNAKARGSRVAMRHKDLGIWQSWTWGQMLDEVRAFSVGLMELGLTRGDMIAVIGKNKPRLYWAMCAAQALGAVPLPI